MLHNYLTEKKGLQPFNNWLNPEGEPYLQKMGQFLIYLTYMDSIHLNKWGQYAMCLLNTSCDQKGRLIGRKEQLFHNIPSHTDMCTITINKAKKALTLIAKISEEIIGFIPCLIYVSSQINVA